MRATNGAARHQLQKRVLKRAKGMRGGRHSQYRVAIESIKRAERQAFIGRKLKKRDFRQTWINRINIASRALGLPYSRLIAGLLKADIRLDRKQLSELAISQPEAFANIVKQVQTVLASAPTATSAAGVKGYYEILPSADGKFYFNLKAGNHEIILTGSMLATAAAVTAAIEQVRARAGSAASFKTDKASNGELFFVVTAADGSTLGRSETYPTEAVTNKGIESVKRNSASKKVVGA